MGDLKEIIYRGVRYNVSFNNGKFWSSDFKGIAFDAEEELHDRVKGIINKRRRDKLINDIFETFTVIGIPVFRISMILVAIFLIIKLVKFFWYL